MERECHGVAEEVECSLILTMAGCQSYGLWLDLADMTAYCEGSNLPKGLALEMNWRVSVFNQVEAFLSRLIVEEKQGSRRRR